MKKFQIKMAKSNFPIDENGVPVLNSNDIEVKAEEVISFFDKIILEKPQRTPLLDFIEKLHKQSKIKRDYSLSLGKTKNGKTILGKIQLKPLGLFIDKSLANDNRFNFILGHEFGHIVFHRSINIKKTGYEEQEIIDTEINLVTGKKNLKTARDWLEWQANYFASAILMPRSTIMRAVIEKQQEMGITENRLGRIFLEAKEYNVRDYKTIQKHLGLIYNVSATNVEYRLKDLGILIDRMNLNKKHISELFKME